MLQIKSGFLSSLVTFSAFFNLHLPSLALFSKYFETLKVHSQKFRNAKQLYWNHTSPWVFSGKFVAYFQNIFSWEHLRMAASAKCWSNATLLLVDYFQWSLIYKFYLVVQFSIVEHPSCQNIWKLGYFKGFYFWLILFKFS